MFYLRFAPLTIVLLACGPGDDSTGAADTSAAASTGTSGSTGITPTTGSADTSADTSTASDASTVDPPDTSTGVDTSDVSTATGSSTGEADFCQGWQTAEGAPFLVLHDRLGNELAPGSSLPLECGGQGQFMFGLYPTFGGFVPPGDILDFKLVVDVDGFNENPESHFYSADPVGYYVDCDPQIGGVFGVLPVFPFDNLEDLTALDGKPAHLEVAMPTGGEPLVLELDVVLAVAKDDSWGFCGG